MPVHPVVLDLKRQNNTGAKDAVAIAMTVSNNSHWHFVYPQIIGIKTSTNDEGIYPGCKPYRKRLSAKDHAL